MIIEVSTKQLIPVQSVTGRNHTQFKTAGRSPGLPGQNVSVVLPGPLDLLALQGTLELVLKNAQKEKKNPLLFQIFKARGWPHVTQPIRTRSSESKTNPFKKPDFPLHWVVMFLTRSEKSFCLTRW